MRHAAAPLPAIVGRPRATATLMEDENGWVLFKTTKRIVVATAAAALSLLRADPNTADAQSTGSVELQGLQCRVHYRRLPGGTGTLNFKRKTYPLSVGGLSAGTIGVTVAEFVGTASNLRTARDIVGTYSVAGAGLTVVGGVSAVTLQNSNGVVLRLRGRQAGLNATLGVGGVEIRMQDGSGALRSVSTRAAGAISGLIATAMPKAMPPIKAVMLAAPAIAVIRRVQLALITYVARRFFGRRAASIRFRTGDLSATVGSGATRRP